MKKAKPKAGRYQLFKKNLCSLGADKAFKYHTVGLKANRQLRKDKANTITAR